MLINSTSQRLSESLPPNLAGSGTQETELVRASQDLSTNSARADSLQVSSQRAAIAEVNPTDDLDGTTALAAVNFALRSIELNPGAAISVQANARPENVLELLKETVLA